MHNRYRVKGGEERSVELQLRALRRAGVEHALLERRSAEVSRAGAAAALLRGGRREEDVAAAVRDLGADVVHVHNMLPLVGPRGLAAARDSGAAVVLHLHNLRLFCAIGVASRDGGPCFRCHGRLTLPGLALNCRGSLPEAVVYAAALSLHQPAVLRAVDRFVAPSRYAVGQLAMLGAPADRLEALPHYLPAEAFAERSRAADGGYALVAARLSVEKGIDTAIEAASRAGVPLRVAGEGPAASDLAAQARRLRAPLELLGRVDREELGQLLAGAGALLMPSRYHEFSPYAALEAMAAGVPVIASRLGGLPELLGQERCIPPNDPGTLAERLAELWEEPERRRAEGDALMRRARERHREERFTRELLRLYEGVE
ncbi:MAG: glycosyltransferase family 4 protein [Thermoleophilaceae bacterium]|nr:glycosyltransferase family 4 protein [Thermoleophilaceae bacterium]